MNLVHRLLLDTTQGEPKPALTLDKQVTETTVVCDPGRQNTKHTTSLVHSNRSRPCTDRKEEEGSGEEEEQRNQANITTKGTDAKKTRQDHVSRQLGKDSQEQGGEDKPCDQVYTDCL